MKRTLIVVALAVGAASFACARAETAGVPPGNDEETLMRIERELTDAMLKGDPSAVERHYADGFTFTTPDGEVMTKAQVVTNVRTGAAKFESSKFEEMKVQVYGDTAVVTSRTTDKGAVGGVDVSGQFRWTDVFVRRGGRWQLVAAQGTRVAKGVDR